VFAVYPSVRGGRPEDTTDASEQETPMQEPEREELVTDRTRRAEREDAEVTAGADRPPTEEEERIAEEQELDPEAAAAYKEQIERGAAAKGEGRIP
jgi:hypothetical protein